MNFGNKFPMGVENKIKDGKLEILIKNKQKEAFEVRKSQ